MAKKVKAVKKATYENDDDKASRKQDVKESMSKPAFKGDPAGGHSADADNKSAGGPADLHADDAGGSKAVSEGKKEAYKVLSHGAVIFGTHYPNAKAKKGEEMTVSMTVADARKHQNAGVALSKIE